MKWIEIVEICQILVKKKRNTDYDFLPRLYVGGNEKYRSEN